ncbi:MAG TPA: sialidase family protein, partial [Candidatus Thermoplasmatota archaeon]|nr:sialidase family protein [Candidatus Thermoplasmatota archaeon]
MARAPLLALAALLVAGCAAPLDGIDPGSTPRAVGDLLVSEAVTLTTPEGPGFEPGIAVAPDGALYAAAAKTQRPHSGGRLADWLWHSQDGGATWNDVPAPDAFRLMPGLEGDVAVDGEGRLYYLDIWGPDLSVSRWSPGPTWDWSRPVAGTPAPLDDRPFAAAHGDGRVYLLSNQAVEGQRIVVSRSLDGGVTWTQAFAFPGSLFCRIDASPADDKTV